MNRQTRFTVQRPAPLASMPMPGQGFDLKAVFSALRRRFWLGVASFLAVFLLIAIYTFQQTPVYTAQARLMLNTQENNTIDLGSAFSGLAPDTAIIDTELEVIKSEAMLAKVVEELELTKVAEFNYTLQQPSQVDRFIDSAKSAISGLLPGSSSVSGDDADAAEDMTEEERREAIEGYALWKLGNVLSVQRLGPTYVIDISARSTSPRRASEIANAVADQYLVNQLEAKLESARRANKWLSERLSALKDEVSAKERAVEAYRNESGLLSAEGSTLTEQEIADLNRQRSERVAALSEAEARLESVRARAGNNPEAIAEVLSSPVVSDLRRQLAEVQRRQADLLTKYGPRHPDVQRVNNEIADMRQQVRSEVDRIVSSIESEVGIARQRVRAIDRQLASARSRLERNNRANVRLRELQREAEASRTLYEDFLERFKKTDNQDELAKADARILSDASPPKSPSSPNIPVNLILGFVLAGATSGGLILLGELRENHFSTGEEIERAFNIPAIGNIPLLPPRARRSPADYAIANPLSAFSESMRNLRASIVFADLDNPARTVAICSSLPNEGKTMTTFSLGRLSAMSGSRTLVIDGDFRRRQLTEAAGLAPENGLIEHLFGEVSLEEALHLDEASGAHVLPLTSSRKTPRDVFGSRAFDALLDRLQEMYDLIVIDTGPILLMAESRVIVSKVDQVIVVAKWRMTTRPALGQTMGILEQFNANIAGVVLNFVDFRKRRFLSSTGATYKAYRKYYSEGPV